MRLIEFNMLPEIQKMRELWAKGILVAEREEGEYRYELYQLDGFYAEQQISIIYNLRKAFKTFKSVDLLEPYLDALDISSIWSDINNL